MARHFTGGCACGAVRYDTAGEPVFENHCRCRDCTKRSGTGHGSYLTFGDRDSFAVTGKIAEWSLPGDSGSLKRYGFCPTCGTPLFQTYPEMPDLITITAGSLDKPELFHPQVVTYESRALAWDRMDTTLPAFERMPPG